MPYRIGDYEVVEKIGSGAMGDVFKGRDIKNDNLVAIKILSDDLSGNPRAVDRFKREIRQTIQLNHPNIISACAAGEFKGRLYYVMEFIDGTTVKKKIITNGSYEEQKALEIILQIASALEYAAKFGIIHRDIKPDNIMITVDSKAKLCDLGLAKSTESDNKLTVMGTVLGTPHYMSPEQAQGEDNLDERSDIFSLGATFYHMLTGSPPFDGPDPITIMTRLLESSPPHIQERNPRVSDETCQVVDMMMKKNKNERYQSFAELVKELKKRISEPVKKRTISAKFYECYIPSQSDVLLGQIAVHNKVTVPAKMEACLNRQESLYLMGVELDISDIMVEQKIISNQQRSLLHKAKIQFLLDRFDECFFKSCESNNLLSPIEINEAKNYKASGHKGVGAFLLSQGKISEDKRQKIYANIKMLLTSEEGKAVLKCALDSKVLTQTQIERTSRIYSNTIVMGKYRSVGQILVEKEYLHNNDFQALLRGVRRSMITGQPATKYIQEKRIQ